MAAVFLTACTSSGPARPPAAPTPAPAPAETAQAPAPTPTAKPAPGSPAPAPAPPPAPRAPAAGATGQLPIGRGDFGSQSPTFVKAADPQERWVALCQARSDTDGDGKIEVHVGHHGDLYGDTMDLYLVLGGGGGTPIEALASRSADDRWLAIVRGGKLELVDAQSGDVFEMRGADTASDGRPGATHRAGVFAGGKLLYIRHPASGDDKLVVHDTADHRERELAVPGRLWRIDYRPDRVAHIFTIPQGQPFPMLQTTLGRGECLGPPMSYSTYGNSGPKPTERWIDLDSGALLAGDGAQVAVGTTLVRTPADGAIYLDADQIAPPACKAQLLAVMPSPARVIAICGEKKQAKVLLLGKGLKQELASIDRDADHYSRMSSVPDGASAACASGLHCVATATNAPIDLKGGVVDYAWGTKLYVVHATTSSRTHEVIDVATGKRTPIASTDEQLSEGRYVVDYAYNLVDLDTATILGKVPRSAMRLSAKGRVLITAPPPAPVKSVQPEPESDMGTGGGPLRWVAP